MPNIALMYWNIENLGDTKYKSHGPALLDYIAAVAVHNNVALIAMNEIRAGLGGTIGHGLATRMPGGAAVWSSDPSPSFMAGREEGYCFVWNTGQLVKTSFQYEFPDPLNPGHWIGFPQQRAAARPPYLGCFTDAVGATTFRIAAFHAPGPGWWPDVRKGNQALGRVQEFRGGHVGVVMGDCNVKIDANSYTAGSFGDLAFSPLRAANAAGNGFAQATCSPANDPSLTSLIAPKSQFVGMTIQDAYSQPYDQAFVQTNPGVTVNYAGRDELLADSQNPGYLEASLLAIAQRLWLAPPLNFVDVRSTFETYRVGVSDHVPVIVDLIY